MPGFDAAKLLTRRQWHDSPLTKSRSTSQTTSY
jgi:hypothetical protein